MLLFLLGLVYLFLTPKEANHYIGYRCYFGMGSVNAWRFTQRLAGIVFGSLGLILGSVMLLTVASFRQMELDALRSIIQCSTAPSLLPHNHVVLSLGGGAVMTPECAKLVKENTLCIYLRTSVDTLVERLTNEAAGRPLLASDSDLRTRIETLMAKRASTYEATAHHIIDTDGLSIDDLANGLVHLLK